MGNGIAFLAGSLLKTGPSVLTQEVDFGIEGFWQINFFGQKVWLTTSHVSMLIILVLLIGFAIVANIVIRKANPNQVPGKFLNFIELIVETLDKMTLSSMGTKHGHKFQNYIGTLFIFILFSNLSGLIGLRSATADYGTTLCLGLITFSLIHINTFKHQSLKQIWI